MPFEGEDIQLSASARGELEEIARSQALPAGFVLRAKIVLLLAEGLSYEVIQSKLDTHGPDDFAMEEAVFDERTRRIRNTTPRPAASEIDGEATRKNFRSDTTSPARRLDPLGLPQTGP